MDTQTVIPPTTTSDQTTPPLEAAAAANVYLESLIFSIGPLTCLIAASYGQRAWARWEILQASGVAAAFILKPEFILGNLMNSSVQQFHLFLCTLYAAYLLTSIAHPLFLMSSKDVSISYGHYFGKIVSGTLIVIEDLLAYSEGTHWNYKYLCLKTSLVLTNVIISAYFLARTPKPSGQNPFIDRANSVGKLDFYILIIYGVYIYAFPDHFNAIFSSTAAGNESYRSLTRTFGALFVGLSIESFCMSEFKFIRDKKRFLFARFLGGLVEFAAIYSGHSHFGIYSFETVKTLLITNVVYDVILLFSFILTPREHKKVQ